MQGDDLERQDVDRKHGCHGQGTFNSKVTHLLTSHEVMFVVLREHVSVLCVKLDASICMDDLVHFVFVCVHICN